MDIKAVVCAQTFAIFLVLSLTYTAHSFYCGEGGRNLAREGLHKYQILKNCGQPTNKEKVGVDWSASSDHRSGSIRIVEEWFYVIEEYGHKRMYLIKFDEKGIAAEIEFLGDD